MQQRMLTGESLSKLCQGYGSDAIKTARPFTLVVFDITCVSAWGVLWGQGHSRTSTDTPIHGIEHLRVERSLETLV